MISLRLETVNGRLCRRGSRFVSHRDPRVPSLSCVSGTRRQPETSTHQPRANGSERVVRTVTSRLDDMIFELAQRGELLVQCADRFWIAQGVATPKVAAFNRGFKGRAKYDVMKGRFQSSERMNEPGPYDSIHHDEITSFGISFGGLGEDRHNHFVLVTGRGKVRWNCSFPDEMPEVIRMQMNGWTSRSRNQASRCGALPGARRAGQNEDVSRQIEHSVLSLMPVYSTFPDSQPATDLNLDSFSMAQPQFW